MIDNRANLVPQRFLTVAALFVMKNYFAVPRSEFGPVRKV